MRVHHLNTATLCPPAGAWAGVTQIICHCLLIELEDTLVLVDTGLGREDVAGPGRLGRGFMALSGPALRPEETAHAQVRALGFDPEDVGHICLTHLDLDHAGGLADFPRARVHLMAGEQRAATGRLSLRTRQRYRPAQWAHGPRWETYEADGERWFGLPRVRRLAGLPPEILLVALAGHSPGHCGVAVQSGERWLLHAGDAYYDRREIHPTRPGCPPGLALMQRFVETDRAARLETCERLRQLARLQDGVRVFCAHDPQELADLSR